MEGVSDLVFAPHPSRIKHPFSSAPIFTTCPHAAGRIRLDEANGVPVFEKTSSIGQFPPILTARPRFNGEDGCRRMRLSRPKSLRNDSFDILEANLS